MKSNNILKLLLLIFLFVGQISIAQIKIGAKVGYSDGRINDNSDNIYAQEYDSSSGVDFGITAEFPVNDLFSIQTEIIYTERGGERKGLQPIPSYSLSGLGSVDQLNYLLQLQGKPPVTDEDPLYADFSNIAELNYLEIPILAKLGWGETWRFYAEAGVYFGFLVKSTNITEGESIIYLDAEASDPLYVANPNYDPGDPNSGPLWVPLPPQEFDAETDTKNDLNTWNVGFHAGAGLIRKLAEKHEIYIGFRGSYSFNTVQKDKTFGESHIGGLVFNLGYAYTL